MGRRRMTGSEAWAVLHPVIAKLVDDEQDGEGIYDEVYATAFLALKEYDQSRGRKFSVTDQK